VRKLSNIYLNSFLKEHQYKDALIMDNNNGKIIFSAKYPQYIGKVLNSEKFKNSHMAKLWKKTIKTQKTQISDMHKPFLYSDDPVMLLATPIFQDNRIIAVLMLKLPSDTINKTLHFRASTSESLKTYAVGQDNLLRSDSSLKKDLTVKNSFNYPKKYFMYSESINKALNGINKKNLIKDYRNINVFSVYTPLEFDSFRWVIISEIDEREVYGKLDEVKQTMYRWGLIATLFIFFLGYFILKIVIENNVIYPLIKLYKKAKGFENIINYSSNEIYIFTKERFFFTFANNSAIMNIGYTLEELQKMKHCDIKPEYDEASFSELIRPLLNGDKKNQILETVHRRKNGSLYDVKLSLQLIEVDGICRFVAVVNDVSKYNQTIKEKNYYYNLSSYDYLTQIFNRQMLEKLFKKEVERSHRYNSELSMILLDIDCFKEVNDTFGHQAGDEVLKCLSSHISNSLRDSDIFARWGGEEFVILMPNTNITLAVEKANLLRESIEKLDIENICSVTCSFGVVQMSDFENINQIFKQADEALYKAKTNGRNRVETI
jgi:diguanylate cyclase (GGDEF)-like protein/PAS domain S-box-containing protein